MFNIQDSSYSGSYSLHEAILAASERAQSGGGAFAFVSSTGVELCFKDEALRPIVSEGQYELIVGVDQITNPQALNALKEIIDDNPGFNVRAYLSPENGTIFHPKFAWFEREHGGTLVLGSGNLTLNGLRRNCEAFILEELDQFKMAEFLLKWNQWRHEISDRLEPIDSQLIVEQAARNLRAAVRIRANGDDPEAAAVGKVEAPAVGNEAEDEQEQLSTHAFDDWEISDDHEVLVAEIPKASNRWNQANFDKHSFEDFFGATAGDNTHRILLNHVSNDGLYSSIESRQSVSVMSKNYRFELNAVANLKYPDEGRPIGVFIRVNVRMFLYVLALPGAPYYEEIQNWLASNYTGRKDRMKRARTSVQVLKLKVPQLPFWRGFV